jgi:hypothetical protein
MAPTSQPQDNHNTATPKWKYMASIYYSMRQYVVFRDEALGLQRQLVLRRNPLFFQSCDREYFFIDGDNRSFRNERAMLRALRTCDPDRRRPLDWRVIETGSWKSVVSTIKQTVATLSALIHSTDERTERLEQSGVTMTW